MQNSGCAVLVFVSWPQIALPEVLCGKAHCYISKPTCLPKMMFFFGECPHLNALKLTGRMLHCGWTNFSFNTKMQIMYFWYWNFHFFSLGVAWLLIGDFSVLFVHPSGNPKFHCKLPYFLRRVDSSNNIAKTPEQVLFSIFLLVFCSKLSLWYFMEAASQF